MRIAQLKASSFSFFVSLAPSCFICISVALARAEEAKPTLFIVGDSTGRPALERRHVAQELGLPRLESHERGVAARRANHRIGRLRRSIAQCVRPRSVPPLFGSARHLADKASGACLSVRARDAI